jgi:hypothetical protein
MTSKEKKFQNGHKTFNSAEAKALDELLKSERQKADYFNENKFQILRARNPLTGEETPREGEGEPVMNLNWEYRDLPPKVEITSKVGISPEKYAILGNSPKAPRSSAPRYR